MDTDRNCRFGLSTCATAYGSKVCQGQSLTNVRAEALTCQEAVPRWWRLIQVDNPTPDEVLDALRNVPGITVARLVELWEPQMNTDEHR
jgi:hypothetical protein